MKKKKISLLLLAIFTLFSSVALGSEGEPLPYGNFALRVLNIIIFVGIIWYFAGAKFKDFFGGRKERILSEFASLETRKEQAVQDLNDVEARIKNIDAERAAIIDSSRKSAEEMAKNIIAEAEKMASQIQSQAVKNMEQTAKTMENEIRSQLADEIVQKLENNMLSKLDSTEHKKLINSSLTKVVLQ